MIARRRRKPFAQTEINASPEAAFRLAYAKLFPQGPWGDPLRMNHMRSFVSLLDANEDSHGAPIKRRPSNV